LILKIPGLIPIHPWAVPCRVLMMLKAGYHIKGRIDQKSVEFLSGPDGKGHGNNKIYHTACLFTWFPRCANMHIFQYAHIGAP